MHFPKVFLLKTYVPLDMRYPKALAKELFKTRLAKVRVRLSKTNKIAYISNMEKIFFLAALLFCTPGYAENHLLLLGGSGDPPGETTIFDTTAQSLGKFARAKNYSSTVAFNGGHPHTETMLKKEFQQSSPFSDGNYKRLIADYGQNIKNNENVIIFVNTHGDAGGNPQKSHSITCGQTHCELDELNTLIKSLEDKDAKVAVIDASCYSGSSVRLGTSKTCVLTSTREDSVGYTQTNSLLAEELGSTKNKNLEEVFLKAHAGFFGQANINSPAGKKTRDLLNQFYEDFKNPKAKGEPLQLHDCSFDQNQSLKKLRLLKKQFQQITGKTEPEFKQIESALNDYQKRLDRAQQLVDSTKTLENTPVDPSEGMLTWNSLTHLSKEKINQQISELTVELKQTSNPVGQKELSDQIALLKSVDKIKSDLRARNPQFAKYEKDSSELNTLLYADPHNIPDGSILMGQFNILKPEKSLYHKIYQTFKEPNACSSFTL